jgi:hypothetical protein
MSTTTLSRISPLTLDKFNSLLEDNKPYSLSYFKNIEPTSTIDLDNISLKYLPNLKILICSKHSIYLDNNLDTIIKHFKVSISLVL